MHHVETTGAKDKVFLKDNGRTTVKTLNNVEKNLSILAVLSNFQSPFSIKA